MKDIPFDADVFMMNGKRYIPESVKQGLLSGTNKTT